MNISIRQVKVAYQIVQAILVFFLSSSTVIPQKTVSSAHEPGDSVKIGLLIPDNKSAAAEYGAGLAIRKANENGGFHGIPFRLVTRSMEGPWGTGSKQAVSLIFEEKVWALLGSHDGRNAHLVEQAATKAIVPFVSAWAGDPTLSQAFVPWFFNCVPNDFQQAEMLFNEICLKRSLSRIALISDTDYDSNLAATNFLKKVKLENKPDPYQFIYENFKGDINEMLSRIQTAKAECIVLFCNPSASLEIFRLIKERKMNQPVFSAHYLLNEDALSASDLKYYDNNIMIPSGKWSAPEFSAFKQEYREAYGESPGVVAAYSYDAANVLIRAIMNAGTSDREEIQKALETISYKGITGTISFDDMGNRKGPYLMTTLKDGTPFMPDK